MDSAGIDRLGSLIDAPAGYHAVARNFRQRHQNESTLEQARMWQRQVRLVDREVAIGEDIDIGRARAVSLLMRAVPAELELDVLRAGQQLPWIKCSFNRNREIDEMRLVFETPWRRPVVRGAGLQPYFFSVAKQVDGTVSSLPLGHRGSSV